jgi:hypothetical protein
MIDEDETGIFDNFFHLAKPIKLSDIDAVGSLTSLKCNKKDKKNLKYSRQ